MTASTILYIIIAFLLALFLALFQYKIGSKRAFKGVTIILFSLRTFTIFCVLLLLINPKFEQSSYFNVKPNLIVALDNSESITHLEREEEAREFLNMIRQNDDLNSIFNIEYYRFGNEITKSDSIDFSDNKSNLFMIFDRLSEIYNSDISPTIVVTDGNQTFGRDYVSGSRNFKQAIFPVILGDTTVFTDIKIQQLNANKYSFLNNEFPVEIIAVYNGSDPISTRLNLRMGNTVVFTQAIDFNDTKNSEVISFTLPASAVGVLKYRAELVPLGEEKNKVNNYKDFAVEVINQKTNVAIVTEVIHPDLGALKKSIESNKQRSAEILSRNEYISRIDDFQMVIAYQPNAGFNTIFEALDKAKINKMIISGPKTDFRNLNGMQSHFSQEITRQTEDYQAVLNKNYSIFTIDNIDFSDYPPLTSEFGSLTFNQPVNTLLYKSINGIATNDPLLVTYEIGSAKEAVLNGEGIWRWRAQNFRESGDFSDFDNFFGKLVQYLSSNVPRNRLNINYETVYRETDELLISAQYFNRGYEFDSNAQLNISLRNIETDEVKTYPLILTENNYQIDLSGLLEPGDYAFTISVDGENLSRSGQISVLDYNVEQQFLNADVNKLNQLAINSQGKSYFIDDTANIVDDLLSDSRFAILQKSNKNIVPLVDWKNLLVIIVLSLASEWFIRKYNGLI